MKDLLINNSLNIIGYSGYKDSGESLPLQKNLSIYIQVLVPLVELLSRLAKRLWEWFCYFFSVRQEAEDTASRS